MCSSRGAFKDTEKYHHAQQQACVKTIRIGGLDNVVDARNALSEHLKCGIDHQHNKVCTS